MYNAEVVNKCFNILEISNGDQTIRPLFYSDDAVNFTRNQLLNQKKDGPKLAKFHRENQIDSSRNFIKQPNEPILQCIVGVNLVESVPNSEKGPPVPFCAQWIVQGLGFKTQTPIQEAMWPVITKGCHVCVIGEPRSGRTIGIAAPLFRTILEYSGGMLDQLDNDGDPVLPVAVVLCPFDSDVIHVEKLFNSMVTIFSTPANIVTCYKTEQNEINTTMEMLAKGCNILVITPQCLKILLERLDNLIAKMRFLVLDDGDSLFALFPSPMKFIVKEIEKSMNMVWQVKNPVQIITTCSKWSKDLAIFNDKFCQNQKPAAAVLTAGIEMVVFHGIQPKIYMAAELERKIDIVEDILNDPEQISPCAKVLVCCTTNKEAFELSRWLGQKKDLDILLVLEPVSNKMVMYTQQKWNLARGTFVLIIVDEVLAYFEIRDADCLIHFSLSSLNIFDYRHTCLIKKTSIKQNSKPPEVTVHIMVDNFTTQAQMRCLLQLYVRMNWVLPRRLEDKAQLEFMERRVFYRDSRPSARPRNNGPNPAAS